MSKAIGEFIGATIGMFVKKIIQGAGFATGVLIIAKIAGLVP